VESGKMSKLKSNINTIFFDAGGVLFDTEISRTERIKHILSARGFNDFDIAKGLNKGEEFSDKYLKDGNWLNNWNDEKLYWDKYYEVILNETTHGFTYSLKEQLFHHTHYAIHCKLFDEARTLLENLHGTYKFGVISNAFPSMDWVFDLLDIRKYFDSIIISAFVGEYKPNKNIYELALNSLNAKAEESIFIDDKLKNVEAAENLGFKGIHLDRKINDLSIIQTILDNNSLRSQKYI
jgi:putative hydrolase of the HAD superfamily